MQAGGKPALQITTPLSSTPPAHRAPERRLLNAEHLKSRLGAGAPGWCSGPAPRGRLRSVTAQSDLGAMRGTSFGFAGKLPAASSLSRQIRRKRCWPAWRSDLCAGPAYRHARQKFARACWHQGAGLHGPACHGAAIEIATKPHEAAPDHPRDRGGGRPRLAGNTRTPVLPVHSRAIFPRGSRACVPERSVAAPAGSGIRGLTRPERRPSSRAQFSPSAP